MFPRSDERARREALGIAIVQSFQNLDVVQEQIPDGYALHVGCRFSLEDPTLLPYALTLNVVPLESIIHRKDVVESVIPGDDQPSD